MKQATLRVRLIIGFGMVILPLLILLLLNNLYATKVVHSQVAQSNQNLLKMYMNDMDKVLEEIQNYLYKTAEQDQSLISLSQNEKDSWGYYLAKTQTVNDLYLNTNYYQAADALFAYSSRYDELFVAQQESVSFIQKKAIEVKLHNLLRLQQEDPAFLSEWNIVESEDGTALVRIVSTNYQSYIGTWVNLDRLMQPLHALSKEGKGEALLLSREGRLMSKAGPVVTEALEHNRLQPHLNQEASAYNIVNLPQSYLLVNRTSAMVNMNLLLMLPERTLLEGLPFFRNLTYMVPLAASIMLVLYLIYLQRSIVNPMHSLIRGMRKIRSGDLTARLEAHHLPEFMTIKETFNGMVDQIEHLKIDIYEEQIRTQKAELKHLQAQIHPHFFMNSLNIVYNLAQTRDYDIIQNMALHLVRYFRYTTRTQVTTITIREEMDHINSYLTIQRYRFPMMMNFTFDIDPELEGVEIPPLIVQPLVENAMVHGFSVEQGGPFEIKLRVYRDLEVGAVCIEVQDNGKGITPERVAFLEDSVHGVEPQGSHVGLWNVVRRCRLYYKTAVFMRFSTASPRGAVITLCLPDVGISTRSDLEKAGSIT
ncbi:hypothetical protein SY83_01985 [Paenibacillus swuensis]|uniref:HAMP domain-containing protein n=1 Tax=Paenibacillus swuensis TaxID=1178515 RepID=A0A172TEH0_9BACL|nr:histidine kinase [Paenibacillus swuensis]ANE45304.1 hypothetical protein SY83_01985 [Paenibacillus swuensis]